MDEILFHLARLWKMLSFIAACFLLIFLVAGDLQPEMCSFLIGALTSGINALILAYMVSQVTNRKRGLLGGAGLFLRLTVAFIATILSLKWPGINFMALGMGLLTGPIVFLGLAIYSGIQKERGEKRA